MRQLGETSGWGGGGHSSTFLMDGLNVFSSVVCCRNTGYRVFCVLRAPVFEALDTWNLSNKDGVGRLNPFHRVLLHKRLDCRKIWDFICDSPFVSSKINQVLQSSITLGRTTRTAFHGIHASNFLNGKWDLCLVGSLRRAQMRTTTDQLICSGPKGFNSHKKEAFHCLDSLDNKALS